MEEQFTFTKSQLVAAFEKWDVDLLANKDNYVSIE